MSLRKKFEKETKITMGYAYDINKKYIKWLENYCKKIIKLLKQAQIYTENSLYIKIKKELNKIKYI